MDATRCISYLTIEHAGPIPLEFRALIGNRIYGCDDCLAVCPWNRFAVSPTPHQKLRARTDLVAPDLSYLASLGDEGFRRLFAGSPIKRIGWRRFLRNVLIAIGNSGEPPLLAAVRPHLNHDDPVVAEAAVWAQMRIEA
jgi:epoxyqueuosine reductase